MSNICECDRRGTDPAHEPGACESSGRLHLRNGRRVWLCVDCTMPGDMRANWAVGHNMPGYLPESDVFITSDWESARDVLLDILDRASDYAFEVGNAREGTDIVEAMDDLQKAEPSTEWGDIIGNTSYWLNATDEEPEDEE